MKELIILVGRQGSGKTFYAERELTGCVRVCQDEGPRHFDGLFRHYQDLLDQGVERIVIDRTNPTRTRRRQFAEAARAAAYRVKIIYFDVPRRVCQERILAREDHPTLEADEMYQAIADYESRFEMPAADECDELVVIRQGA